MNAPLTTPLPAASPLSVERVRHTLQARHLQVVRRTLLSLLEHCHGDARPQCPILDDLAGGEEAAH